MAKIKIDDSGLYLVTKSREANELTGLYLPNQGATQRRFQDIAELDLLTMDMPYRCLKDTLQKYNDADIVEITDTFMDAQRLKNNSVKLYHPLFKFEKTVATEYIQTLKKLASDRYNSLKRTGNVGKISDTEDVRIYRYELLKQLIAGNNAYITSAQSLLGENVKAEIRRTGNYMTPAEKTRFVVSNTAVRGTLTTYTQLRNLLIEYLNMINYLDYYIDNAQLSRDDYTCCDLVDDMSFSGIDRIPMTPKTR